MPEWKEEDVQNDYIEAEVEESLTLDYKAAGAFEKSARKKTEITKDVSAMANSAGGVIFYGVAEYNDPDKKHLPENFDPIDNRDYPKEWLQQVINNIRPRIDGLLIHPVSIDTLGQNSYVYVVEVPQSTTAHQAMDYKYYKRFNFQSVPMYDYEIRDVMSRAEKPNPEVEFGYDYQIQKGVHQYKLQVLISNKGTTVIDNYKLEFTFPDYGGHINVRNIASPRHLYFSSVESFTDENGRYSVTFRSKHKLFPEGELDIGKIIQFTYHIDEDAYRKIWQLEQRQFDMSLQWVLYADDMTPKRGTIPFSNLNNY